MGLELLLATIIVYLGYCLGLSTLLQVAINQLKPLFLEPIKERVTDQQYLIVIYAFRTVVSVLAYFYLWGGVEATRAIVTVAFIPDYGLAVVTIGIVVAGEEIIHPIMERFYILRDIAKQLRDLPGPTDKQITVKA